MKNLRLSIATLLFPVLLFVSCRQHVTGSGEIITDERMMDPFQSVEMLGAGDFEIIHGEVQKVAVSGYENLVPLIETTVKKGKLVITTNDEMTLGNSHMKIRVTTPQLREATLAGAGNMDISSFRLSYLKIVLKGAGNVRFSNSESDTIYATLSGAGNMFFIANSYLEATVNGVGNIEYAGDPVVKSKISGVGGVTKK